MEAKRGHRSQKLYMVQNEKQGPFCCFVIKTRAFFTFLLILFVVPIFSAISLPFLRDLAAPAQRYGRNKDPLHPNILRSTEPP